MEASETQMMRDSCFSAGKIMMNKTVIFVYVFVIPILQSQPKGKGLNGVPLNPTYYTKVYYLELNTVITEI